MRPLKGWRDSASVIIVAKNVFCQPKPTNSFNYQVLTLKRSAKSKFMPGTHVYPGGTCSSNDSASEWTNLFETFGIKKENIVGLKNFSHKITAIRETFEETGVLICRSSKVNYGALDLPWGSYIGGAEIKKWQNKVHDNDGEFINLCKEFGVYPDVWSLKEWANWLTPPIFKQRFNTVFFLTAFQEIPASQAEESEVQSIEWNTPLDLLLKNKSDQIILPPPQFYETSRLLNFKDIDDLAHFAHNRPKELEPFQPYAVATDNENCSLYPGDDHYPKTYNVENENVVSFDELPEGNCVHRTVHKPPFYNHVKVKNITPKYGHVLPLNFEHSKL